MASTFASTDRPERASPNTLQRTASSSFPCLCSSCFDWVSSFIPWRSDQSNSVPSTSIPDRIHENEAIAPFASTSTTDRIPESEVMGSSERIQLSASTSTTHPIPESEVMGSIKRIQPSASTSTTDPIPESKVRGAFHGLAPSVRTSASTLMQKPCYDVFINHRGPDVKHTLASSIYNILNNLKVTVFLDSEELEYGDFLPTTLEAVMRSASIHVAIFSKSYAQSPWCLAELSFMLKSGAKIIPIFYYLDPSDLRWVDKGKGMYAQAFKEHEQKGRYSLEQLKEWKTALYHVSFYIGQIIKCNDDEMRLLKNIVNIVLKETKNVPLVVAKHPVGLKEIVEDFEVNTLRSVNQNEFVQIVGIWGMGGSGKTTLAKELYNKTSSSMERFSFVSDVRDAATKGLLQEKQKKLLSDLGVQGLTFDNIEEGMGILSKHLRSVRILVVLDDVDNVEQLDALLPTKDSIERGSLIIVTTRAYDVLKSWSISSIYKMKPLNPLYAKQLFCWHAFLNSSPSEGFNELVEKFLKVCNRLPLSLKVIGAQLYGEFQKEFWESQLHKISRILPSDIQQRLKISYDTLDDEEKEMFLDVACFFIGEESSLAIEVWNGMGWSGLRSLERLLHKCLLELDDKDFISMHDHIRDMGRDIAKKQSPYRLWFPQPVINVQNQKEAREQILPKMIKMTGEIDEFHVWCSHGELMVNTNGGIWPLSPSFVGLKILVISGDSFGEIMCNVTRELVWLRCFQTGQRNLPSGLSMRKLRVLELYEGWRGEHHLQELWGETDGEAPVQLSELLIYNCNKIQGLAKSIGHLKHLKKIVISDGYNVSSLPEEFCLLQSLEHLVLRGSTMLSLPNNFGNLRKLRHLDLSRSSQMRMLPVSFRNVMLLEHLRLQGCSRLSFTPKDFNFLEKITKLEFFNLSGCKQLEEMPCHITNQVSLRELHFGGTSLRELPDNIGRLSRLREMTITVVLLTVLPTALGDLSSLTDLEIERCPKLEHLPDSIGDLSSLTNLTIRYCHKLESLPDTLGYVSSLAILAIEDCPKLETIPKSVRQLSNLQRLTISSCPIRELDFGVTSSLPFGLRNLKEIELTVTKVCRISFSENCCPHLESLHICESRHLEEIEALPKTIESIYLINCEMLKKVPSFARLTSLRRFQLIGCYGIEKIEGLENCTRLTLLTVHTCWDVPGIESLEHIRNLKRLELSANRGSVIERCIQMIQNWPDEIRIYARAVSDAASLLESLLSPKLEIVESISNQKIQSIPKLVQNRASSGDAFMLCFVINCPYSIMTYWGWFQGGGTYGFTLRFEKGRWVWLGVFTGRSNNEFLNSEEFSIEEWIDCEEERVERGLAEQALVEKGWLVTGEEQTAMEAVRSLLPLWKN